MVVPPLALSAVEIRVATAAAAVVVMVLVIPLGNTTRLLASLPLGSAQLIPLKPFVLVVDKANDFPDAFGADANCSVVLSFFEHAARLKTLMHSIKNL